mmetsp:Transcript_13908/g.21690  ORF Transcript_13908/g.21690 Transcript_13908/m.21690 type:complete len:185 (-) Transcript_13908:1530-2084(-)
MTLTKTKTTTTMTTTHTGQEWNTMPPPLPQQSETFAYENSLSNNNNNNLLRNTNVHHPTTASTYRPLPQTATYKDYEEEEEKETASDGGNLSNQSNHCRNSVDDNHRATANETINNKNNNTAGLEGDSPLEEEDGEDMGVVHSLLMKDVSKWIQGLQTVRYDMQMLSVKNAILLDSLAMAGADV